MGRLNSALAEQDKEVRTLAQWLRGLRERSGLTYSQMAHKTETAGFTQPVSLATLSRADEGRTVPTWPVTEAYTRACGGSVRTAERLWLRADANRPGRRTGKRLPGPPPAPGAGRALRYVTERSELLLAMRRLRLRAGSPSLRELEARAVRAAVSHLPRSTLHGVLAGERDCTERVLIEFVRACGAGPAEEAEWIAALHRTRTAPPPDIRRQLADAHAEIHRLRRALDRHPSPGTP
nr:hypothetical protein KitaXyl93_72910 [Kitasatospora sp. Xyl93]